MRSESVSDYLRIAYESQREDELRIEGIGGNQGNEVDEDQERNPDQEGNRDQSLEHDGNEIQDDDEPGNEDSNDQVNEDHPEMSIRRDLHLF
ncbi:uncharacterized protein MELLADRAFT_71960 [Melampsora larici-populina 98AG31]|uniref:Uncharacterized protein n=1 Tax=Melampsora larici-populina (strain 98AG31 / pathotype 3-4-7) TaxID=747676 RepID=F4RMZ0_MELLP|nr:uncharacterized protein MELLADRAFT_71960 [Melampsora larici-populina 98AG31]EGG06201.1 hypothetical protein MELLADRAFT_71960 [Melampsora larici-populina 98AG31]